MNQPSSPDDRNWAVAAHLTAVLNLFSAPLPGLLGAIMTYARTRDRGELARETGREALNLQITLSAVEIALVILIVRAKVNAGTDSLPTSFWVLSTGAITAALTSIAFGIIGATHAARGEFYRYPVAIRLINS